MRCQQEDNLKCTWAVAVQRRTTSTSVGGARRVAFSAASGRVPCRRGDAEHGTCDAADMSTSVLAVAGKARAVVQDVISSERFSFHEYSF